MATDQPHVRSGVRPPFRSWSRERAPRNQKLCPPRRARPMRACAAAVGSALKPMPRPYSMSAARSAPALHWLVGSPSREGFPTRLGWVCGGLFRSPMPRRSPNMRGAARAGRRTCTTCGGGLGQWQVAFVLVVCRDASSSAC